MPRRVHHNAHFLLIVPTPYYLGLRNENRASLLTDETRHRAVAVLFTLHPGNKDIDEVGCTNSADGQASLPWRPELPMIHNTSPFPAALRKSETPSFNLTQSGTDQAARPRAARAAA